MKLSSPCISMTQKPCRKVAVRGEQRERWTANLGMSCRHFPGRGVKRVSEYLLLGAAGHPHHDSHRATLRSAFHHLLATVFKRSFERLAGAGVDDSVEFNLRATGPGNRSPAWPRL